MVFAVKKKRKKEKNIQGTKACMELIKLFLWLWRQIWLRCERKRQYQLPLYSPVSLAKNVM